MRKRAMEKRTRTISLKVPDEVHHAYYKDLNEVHKKECNIDIIATILRHRHVARFDSRAAARELMERE